MCSFASLTLTSINIIAINKVLQKTMTHSPKHLAETSASFYPLPNSQNKHNLTALDFGFIRQQQHQRISNIFRKDGALTEEQVLFEIEKSEQETNNFISSLLQQLAEQTRKNRQLQIEHDALMREKHSQGRKLAEHSIEVTAALQAQRKMWEQEKKQLQRQLKGNSKTRNSLQKECDGMRKLLQQYENQLEITNTKKEYYEAVIIEDKEKLESFLTTIDQLTNTVVRNQAECDKLHQTIQQQHQQICQLQETIEKLQKELEISKKVNEQNKSIKQECLLLKRQRKQQMKLVEHLQMNLLVAKGEAVKQEQITNKIQSSNNRETQQSVSRENELRRTLIQLQAKTKLSMEKLKQSYAKRMRKIVTFYNKQIKNLKSALNGLRQSIQKEMLVCFKLIQRDWRQQSKCMLHY